MAKISIESYDVDLGSFDGKIDLPAFVGGDHLYLIFENDSGQEYVIRGGPELAASVGFGSIIVQSGFKRKSFYQYRRICRFSM